MIWFVYRQLGWLCNWIFHTKSRLKFRKSRIISKPKTNLMKTQRSTLLNTKSNKSIVQKVWIFFENRKVLKLFRFSYKIAKTANSETALTSNNTWIWKLKFRLRVHNESYSILFTHIFDLKRKWFHMCRANNYLFRKNKLYSCQEDWMKKKIPCSRL